MIVESCRLKTRLTVVKNGVCEGKLNQINCTQCSLKDGFHVIVSDRLTANEFEKTEKTEPQAP